MPKQSSLFDDEPGDALTLPRLGVPGSERTLSKAQKLFNKTIASLEAQRRLLAQWHAFVPIYQARVAAEFLPLDERLRERRIAMVRLLDQAMADKRALSKRQRAKVTDILLGQLSELLAQARDDALVELYDKYSGGDFDAEQREEREFLDAFASDVLGIDPDAEPDDGPEPAVPPQARPKKTGAKSTAKGAAAQAKADARETARELADQGASRSVREVYRKLASELHPDREADPAERERKTALMQRVNQAYTANDLHTLLELQLSVEQIDAAGLAGMAQDRLAHYNRVLKEQLERLQDELAELTMPFQLMMNGRGGARELTPDRIQRVLDTDVRELQLMLRALETDLERFQDIRQLKDSLKQYRLQNDGADDEFEFQMFQDMLAAAIATPPRPRRRRR